ncbi:hypothetical protein D9C73_018866 [Collichthys lucidus]|uniref:Ig-like domain-containing protein n=1 Tax=Collichthys lucidus TaxID=240159 RepID=A0A4U5V940_COLLU|nr:hypothetical protein D9C73_018866 [Collichthys lucidus]
MSSPWLDFLFSSILSLSLSLSITPSLTASSPVDTSSSLSSSGSSIPSAFPSSPSSSSSSSSTTSSSTKPHNVEAWEAEVKLLPPLLKDQAWGVHAQEAFLLFCLALGPSDVHIHWLINGHSLDTPIMEFRRPLGQREVLVSSWLREGPLLKDARYHCVAEASTGNDMSEVDLRLAIRGRDSRITAAPSGRKTVGGPSGVSGSLLTDTEHYNE